MNSSIQRSDDTGDFKVINESFVMPSDVYEALRKLSGKTYCLPIIYKRQVEDSSTSNIPNPDYVPAPFRALMGTSWNGDWYEWIETDPTAPMITPQFRNPPENNSPQQ